MAVEAKRGCGYRKVGGKYLVGGGVGVECDRLPISLQVCPTCGHGIKQARGWTWVDVPGLVGGAHRACVDGFPCPLCMHPAAVGKAGLLWVGERFYRTPGDFVREGHAMGYSRRISAVPHGFVPGETWVLLGHPKAVACALCAHPTQQDGQNGPKCPACGGSRHTPGIFLVWRPEAIEQIVTATQSRDAEFMADLAKRHIRTAVVPDDDKDHRGTAYDEDEASGDAAKAIA